MSSFLSTLSTVDIVERIPGLPGAESRDFPGGAISRFWIVRAGLNELLLYGCVGAGERGVVE